MVPSNAGGAAPFDGDALLRAVNNLRERVSLQEAEIDNLRAAVRFVHKQNDREPLGAGVTALDSSVADRIAGLEARSAEHAHTVQQFVTVMARTDSNLQRLAVELDRLLTRLEIRAFAPSAALPDAAVLTVADPATPQPIAAVASETDLNPFPPAPAAAFYLADEEDEEPPRRGWKTSAAVLAILVSMLVGAVLVIRHAQKVSAGGNGASASSIFSPMERARMFENERKFPAAEATYREILSHDPHNADAIRHLASVLFRENKIEESSVVLKQLVPSGSDQ